MPVARKQVEKERRSLLEDRRESRLNPKALIRGFKPKETCIAGRIGEFLRYAAGVKAWEGKFLLYEEIAQACYMLGKRPVRTSRDVTSIRSAMSRAKDRLISEHGQTIVTLPGVGARLTKNHADKGQNAFVPAMQRMETAIKKVVQIRAIINKSKATKEVRKEKDPEVKEVQTKVVAAIDEFDVAQNQLTGQKTTKAIEAAGEAREAMKDLKDK
jgi:hypothetical protein